MGARLSMPAAAAAAGIVAIRPPIGGLPAGFSVARMRIGAAISSGGGVVVAIVVMAAAIVRLLARLLAVLLIDASTMNIAIATTPMVVTMSAGAVGVWGLADGRAPNHTGVLVRRTLL
jgi:hypothetical protein